MGPFQWQEGQKDQTQGVAFNMVVYLDDAKGG